jgi:hypothetical protein
MLTFTSDTELTIVVIALILMVIGILTLIFLPEFAVLCILISGLGTGGSIVYHNLIDDHRSLREVDGYITVDKSKVTINELPYNYSYETLDNDKKLKSSEKQVFHYEENPNFDAAYLVTEDGSRFKLSDEDKEYLKERGVS